MNKRNGSFQKSVYSIALKVFIPRIKKAIEAWYSFPNLRGVYLYLAPSPLLDLPDPFRYLKFFLVDLAVFLSLVLPSVGSTV